MFDFHVTHTPAFLTHAGCEKSLSKPTRRGPMQSPRYEPRVKDQYISFAPYVCVIGCIHNECRHLTHTHTHLPVAVCRCMTLAQAGFAEQTLAIAAMEKEALAAQLEAVQCDVAALQNHSRELSESLHARDSLLSTQNASLSALQDANAQQVTAWHTHTCTRICSLATIRLVVCICMHVYVCVSICLCVSVWGGGGVSSLSGYSTSTPGAHRMYVCSCRICSSEPAF